MKKIELEPFEISVIVNSLKERVSMLAAIDISDSTGHPRISDSKLQAMKQALLLIEKLEKAREDGGN